VELAGLGLVGEDRVVDGEIGYARNGGVAIAYRVVGDGDVDLVLVPDWVSNLVFWWLSPHWRGFYERLARRFRLILFDKRGTGLSDHGPQYATLETRMEDMRAVLDVAWLPIRSSQIRRRGALWPARGKNWAKVFFGCANHRSKKALFPGPF
jgi:hypothetical protein